MLIADEQRAKVSIKVQLALTVVIAALLMFFGAVVSYSALIGGLIAAIANAFLVKRVFTSYRAQAPGLLLAQIYSAEITKLVLVGAFFAAAIAWIEPLSVGALFSVFIVVHLVPSMITLIGR